MYKFSGLLIVICGLILPTIITGLEITKDKTVFLLKTLPVVKNSLMRDFLRLKGIKPDFDNEVHLVTLQDGTMGVFKPTLPSELADAHAEVAAYKASQVLGFPKVPPTVLRKINGKMGSLQLYIESTEYSIEEKNYKQILETASPEEVANLKLFYFVFGQWDSGHHNIIIRKEATGFQLFAIDNAGIKQRQYVKYGDLPFVRIYYSDTLKTNDWHLPFSLDKVKIVENTSIENLNKEFGNKFPARLLEGLSRHKNQLSYIIYKNSLWVQYHKFDPLFVMSYTTYYPEKSIVKLQSLNKKVLEIIFSEAKGSDFLTNEYLDAILERRDQVIRAYEKQKSHIL